MEIDKNNTKRFESEILRHLEELLYRCNVDENSRELQDGL